MPRDISRSYMKFYIVVVKSWIKVKRAPVWRNLLCPIENNYEFMCCFFHYLLLILMMSLFFLNLTINDHEPGFLVSRASKLGLETHYHEALSILQNWSRSVSIQIAFLVFKMWIIKWNNLFLFHEESLFIVILVNTLHNDKYLWKLIGTPLI